MVARVAFDCPALYAALDVRRREAELGWYDVADLVWEQSADLNAERDGEHRMCGGAMQRLAEHERTSAQYALFMLRWLDRAPEDFLVGPVVDVGDTALPPAGSHRRLRWDLAELYAAVDERRVAAGYTWAALGRELGYPPARLTHLRTARTADLTLVLQLTQWLGRPAAAFIHEAAW